MIKYIPYENLSAHHWMIIQKQITKKLSLKKRLINKIKITLKINWYNFKHYILSIPII